jgi:acetyl-CoA C-acetyltransferase
MALDPRTPVIVGTGQLNQRVDRGDPSLEPVDLLAEAARRAAADAGAPALLTSIDSVRVVSMLSWRYRDPGRLVAERVGATPRQSLYSTGGGNTPQALVNQTALDIQSGRLDVALIGGAEAWRTRMAYRAEGGRPPWTIEPDDTPLAAVFGDELEMSHPAELQLGLLMPVQVYPMFETAIRAGTGRTPAEHLDVIATLWSRFSAVAARNPNAWIQEEFSPEQIRTPGPDNRMVGYPYPKLMNSNNHVEQSAALVMCSVERARALGIPADRWVFPHAGADGHDHPFMSNRADLRSSPAIAAVGAAALELAGIGIDDVAHVDLYSCFPSAVETAAAALGLGLDRDLTVTGGLSFAGGPWNNYVTHGIATMVDVLRRSAGAYGVCTANGGLITKHAVGVYSTAPPATGFRWTYPQDGIDALPRREVAGDYAGPATVEAYTVMHSREGEPENGLAAVLVADGRRAWASTQDAALLAEMIAEEFVGRAVTITAGTLG